MLIGQAIVCARRSEERNMKIYFAYGMVSAIMLLITILFYSYKNWLALRKNFVYIWLLLFAFIVVSVDTIFGNASLSHAQFFEHFDKISGTVISVSLLMLYFYLFLYDMAVTCQMRLVRTSLFRVFLGIITLAGMFSVLLPLMGLSGLSYHNQINNGARGNMLQSAVLAVCLVAGVIVILKGRKKLAKQKFYVLLVSQLLLLFDINMQVVLKTGKPASYYILVGVLVSYFLLLHNIDQYRSFSSFCFDRDGFREVLLERAYYKEDFSCMGICINNIESITNFCTEAEIVQFHKRMGTLLRKICGRHNVYHIHSFEYMIMLCRTDSAEQKHEILEKEIPAYFRINNKNISILCGFYTVKFADAGYDITEFNRTITSMRKLTMEQMGRDYLLDYQGENQTEIQNELEALRLVNNCISKRCFGYAFLGIQSMTDASDVSYEFILQETIESGMEISQERIWSLASDTGYIREVGYITFEMLCRAAWENGMLEDESIVFHVNLLSSQLANTALAERYIQILKSHSIPGKRICIELTMDISVDYERLVESFLILQGYGIALMLDQFGVTVCNLKSVLNMPFNCVKINHHMVRTFCAGKNRQLGYMVNMLNARGWTLYLDGVDDVNQLAILSGMSVDYIQGLAVQVDFVRASDETVTAQIEDALMDSIVGGEPVHV